MSTKVSIVTCFNFVLVAIALAFTTMIYYRIILFVGSALNFVYGLTTPTDSTPMLKVDNTYLLIFISFAVFVISFLYTLYSLQ